MPKMEVKKVDGILKYVVSVGQIEYSCPVRYRFSSVESEWVAWNDFVWLATQDLGIVGQAAWDEAMWQADRRYDRVLAIEIIKKASKKWRQK